MTTTLNCPGCGSRVIIPVDGYDPFGDDSVGCANVDQHDDGEKLVMYEADNE